MTDMPGPNLSVFASAEGLEHLTQSLRDSLSRRQRQVKVATTLQRAAELAAALEGRDMESLSRDELHTLNGLVSLAETAKRLIDPPTTRKPAKA